MFEAVPCGLCLEAGRGRVAVARRKAADAAGSGAPAAGPEEGGAWNECGSGKREALEPPPIYMYTYICAYCHTLFTI